MSLSVEQRLKKGQIRTKLDKEAARIKELNIISMEVDFKLMGMTYMDYEDAISRNKDLMNKHDVHIRWNESKKGVVVISWR